jgi:hypothetical protein
MTHSKVYLGDSVYADWRGSDIILTVENRGRVQDGFGPSDEIVLEPEVFDALVLFSGSLRSSSNETDQDVEPAAGDSG